MTFRFKLRRDTANNWENANPVLLAGEPGLETDTNKIKYGNGSDNWNDLPYASGEGGGGDPVTTLSHVELTNKAFIFDPYVSELVTFTKTDYGDEVDTIDTNMAITRGENQGIYNPLLEDGWDSGVSPSGSLWNVDGWGLLNDVKERFYTTFIEVMNYKIGNNVVGKELVMHDTINDKYYAIKFTSWTRAGEGGGFSYTRQLINTSQYFVKTDYGDEVDIISDDLHITRGNQGWLYNPLIDDTSREETPTNSVWNNDGWDDLSNLTERIYQPIYSIWGGYIRNIVGAKMIMQDTSTDKYYAIKFTSWTPGNGGGFSYIRYEIDTTQINEGVKFTDGTVLKTAKGLGSVKSIAPRNRKIVEVTGYTEVSVTEAIASSSVEATIYQDNNGNFDFYVVDTQELIDLSNNQDSFTKIEFSFDSGSTWIESVLSGGATGVWRQIYFADNNEPYVTVTQGQTVLYRTVVGGEPVRWFLAEGNPAGSIAGGNNFRGAIIDFHAYSIDAGTIIGTIHISRDSGDNNVIHTESLSGGNDLTQVDMWYTADNDERELWFRRLDGEADTLKVHWIAKKFYGDEYYD
jgi:hypothetical protein